MNRVYYAKRLEMEVCRMPGLQETTCPLCGARIFDLNLADGEGLLCYNCYRQRAAREKAGDSGEG